MNLHFWLDGFPNRSIAGHMGPSTRFAEERISNAFPLYTYTFMMHSHRPSAYFQNFIAKTPSSRPPTTTISIVLILHHKTASTTHPPIGPIHSTKNSSWTKPNAFRRTDKANNLHDIYISVPLRALHADDGYGNCWTSKQGKERSQELDYGQPKPSNRAFFGQITPQAFKKSCNFIRKDRRSCYDLKGSATADSGRRKVAKCKDLDSPSVKGYSSLRAAEQIHPFFNGRVLRPKTRAVRYATWSLQAKNSEE